MAGLDPATPPDVHWRGSPRPSGERSARLVERSETPASRVRGTSLQRRIDLPLAPANPPPRRNEAATSALSSAVMAGLDPATQPDVHWRGSPRPSRGEVDAPGRAQRDPGKPGEGACSSGPNRSPAKPSTRCAKTRPPTAEPAPAKAGGGATCNRKLLEAQKRGKTKMRQSAAWKSAGGVYRGAAHAVRLRN